jgi:hypothetical protein
MQLATWWPIPVSHNPKSLQWPPLVHSAFWWNTQWNILDSYTVHYRLRRDYPTKCNEILYFLLWWLLHVSAKQCHPQGATMFLSEPLQRQYGRRQVTGHMTERTYRRYLRWLLHVSAKQCHPQGATMFLSEPLQRQYGRIQVTGHMTERTYRRYLRWLLHVSAKQCHPQGTTVFLSEPLFTILYFMILIVSVCVDHNFTFYPEYKTSYIYTATTRFHTAVTYCDVLSYTHFVLSQSLCIFIVWFYCIQTVSYHIDAEVVQKGT